MLNETDHNKLVIELQRPPYAGKNDGECAALLAELSATTGSLKVPVRIIHKYMVAKGIWAALKAAAPANSIADGVLDVIVSKNFTEIDLLDPDSEGMLGTLVGDGVLNGPQKVALQNMSRVTLSIAEALIGQGKSIHHLDVARARGRG